LTHHAGSPFWKSYGQLPRDAQAAADRAFALLKRNSQHPSLHFKKVGRFWSVRIDANYRALAKEVEDGLDWIWRGTHGEYDRIEG
jgi:hypothetical protein